MRRRFGAPAAEMLALLALAAARQPPAEEVTVEDVVALNTLVLFEGTLPTEVMKIRLTANEAASGFLIVVTNRLEVHRAGAPCALFDDLFSIGFNRRRFSFACAAYTVLYESSPLDLRLVPSLWRAVSASLSVTITVAKPSCTANDVFYRPCPNAPTLCVARHLFCDGVDNCGQNADESADCHIDFPVAVPLTIVDERPRAVWLAFGLAAMALAACGLRYSIGGAIFERMAWERGSRRLRASYRRTATAAARRYNKATAATTKQRRNVRWRDGVGASLSAALLPAVGARFRRRNRRHFRRADSLEAEDTVALLTLGLKSVIIAGGGSDAAVAAPAGTAVVYRNLMFGDNFEIV